MDNAELAATSIGINRVLNKSKFDKALARRLNSILEEMDRQIAKALPKLGRKIRDNIKEDLIESEGSGNIYVYLDQDGNEIDRHVASAEGEYPASHTGLLARNIDYVINNNNLTIGVFSRAKRNIKSLYYVPLKSGRIYKKNPLKDLLEEYMEEGVHGAIIVGPGGGEQKTVKEYAAILDRATRPFLKQLTRFYLGQFKKEFREGMKQGMRDKFGDKIQVTFAMTSER